MSAPLVVIMICILASRIRCRVTRLRDVDNVVFLVFGYAVDGFTCAWVGNL